MPTSVAKVQAEHFEFFCPFTGQPVYINDEVNPIPTLLFIFIGQIMTYDYASDHFLQLLEKAGLETEDGSPIDTPDVIAEKLQLTNGFFLEVDMAWNGVTTYGFIVPR